MMPYDETGLTEAMDEVRMAQGREYLDLDTGLGSIAYIPESHRRYARKALRDWREGWYRTWREAIRGATAFIPSVWDREVADGILLTAFPKAPPAGGVLLAYPGQPDTIIR